jgi:hypothetical protein
MKTNIRILIVLSSLAFFTWITIKVVNAFHSNEEALEDLLPSTYIMNNEDSNLFSEKYKSSLKVIEVRQTSERKITMLSVDSNFNLLILKLKLGADTLLTRFAKIAISDSKSGIGYTYHNIENLGYKFQFKSGQVAIASKIYLTFFGDSIHNVIRNDSIINFRLLCGNISLRYGLNEPADIYITREEENLKEFSLIPMDVLLLRRNGALYLMILTKQKNIYIPPLALYNLIRKN